MIDQYQMGDLDKFRLDLWRMSKTTGAGSGNIRQKGNVHVTRLPREAGVGVGVLVILR
jgi:hypothetical protein